MAGVSGIAAVAAAGGVLDQLAHLRVGARAHDGSRKSEKESRGWEVASFSGHWNSL